MNPPQLLDQLAGKFAEAAANSPVKDIEKNMRALAASAFARLDLVTREEFDVQVALLERTMTQLAALEARVAELERELGGQGKGGA